MILLGFIGFLDPPKESAKQSIECLNKAGIRVIVLTGDNAEVTRCICNKVGINSKNIILGNRLDKLSDVAVTRLLKKTNIFAKLSPIQKARLVRLLKEDGNILVKGYVQDDIGKKDISFQEEAVFVVIPQFRIYEKEAEEYLNQYYEVRYKGSVTVGLSGEAVFYVCDLAAAGREI